MSKKSDLPIGWKRGHLTDIASVNPPVSLSGVDNDSVVTFLSMPDVGENGRIIHRQQRKLREVRSGFTRFQEADVLFAKITPCMENGKGAWATDLDNGVGFGSTEFHVLRANDEGDPQFVYHISLFNELRTTAVSAFTGSAGQQRVSADFFARFPLLLPPLSQQRKIATILTTVDNLIEKTEALIAKYQAIKQGMMHDLFTRGIDQHDHLRPPCDEAPELYKQSELGWIPKEWEVVSLSSAATVHYGISDPLDRDLRSGVNILSLPNINIHGELELDDVPKIEPRNVRPSDYLREGDLLFNWRNGSREHLGKTAYFDLSGEWTHVGFLLRVSPDRSQCFPRYLFYELTHRRAIGFFLASKSQVNNTFNSTELEEMLVRLPQSMDEQMAISKRLLALYRRIENEKHYLRNVAKLKTGLMQDLLAGKVRVKVDDSQEAHANV